MKLFSQYINEDLDADIKAAIEKLQATIKIAKEQGVSFKNVDDDLYKQAQRIIDNYEAYGANDSYLKLANKINDKLGKLIKTDNAEDNVKPEEKTEPEKTEDKPEEKTEPEKTDDKTDDKSADNVKPEEKTEPEKTEDKPEEKTEPEKTDDTKKEPTNKPQPKQTDNSLDTVKQLCKGIQDATVLKIMNKVDKSLSDDLKNKLKNDKYNGSDLVIFGNEILQYTNLKNNNDVKEHIDRILKLINKGNA